MDVDGLGVYLSQAVRNGLCKTTLYRTQNGQWQACVAREGDKDAWVCRINVDPAQALADAFVGGPGSVRLQPEVFRGTLPRAADERPWAGVLDSWRRLCG